MMNEPQNTVPEQSNGSYVEILKIINNNTTRTILKEVN
jgi:hypothetical protein